MHTCPAPCIPKGPLAIMGNFRVGSESHKLPSLVLFFLFTRLTSPSIHWRGLQMHLSWLALLTIGLCRQYQAVVLSVWEYRCALAQNIIIDSALRIVYSFPASSPILRTKFAKCRLRASKTLTWKSTSSRDIGSFNLFLLYLVAIAPRPFIPVRL